MLTATQPEPYVDHVRGRPAAIPGSPPRMSWIRLFFVPALICVLRFIPGPVGEASYFLTAGYAVLGRRQAVVSLLLVSLLNNATHVFAGPPALAALTRHIVVVAAALSVFVVHRAGVGRRPYIALAVASSLLCLVILIHSLLFSQFALLSSLKLISFAMTFLTIVVAAGGMSDQQRQALETQVIGIAGAMSLFSAPLVAVSQGYLRTAGFCGLISHPQSFGVMMAMTAVVCWMNSLTQRRLNIRMVIVAATCTGLMLLSKARVGGAALAAGLFVGVAFPVISAIWERWRGQPRVLLRRLGPVIAFGVLALAVAGPTVFRGASQFLVKYGEADEPRSVTDSLWRSRGRMLDIMLKGIRLAPWTGIGFGVPSNEGKSGGVVKDPIFNLPIMATIEKGIMPVAIVEELGYPLAIVVFAWFGWLFWAAAKGGAVSVATLAAAFAVNIAEAVFFSPGGLGLFNMVFLGLAITSSPFNTAIGRKSLF